MTPSQALLSLARDAWPDPTPPEQMPTNLLVWSLLRQRLSGVWRETNGLEVA